MIGDSLLFEDELQSHHLNQGLTMFACAFATNVRLRTQHTRVKVQLLADVLTDALQLATTLARRAV